jgi:hypothetical protein
MGTSRQMIIIIIIIIIIEKTPWLQSASELYRTSDRRLSANLVLTFADRGCRVVSATYPYNNIIGFLDRNNNNNNNNNNKNNKRNVPLSEFMKTSRAVLEFLHDDVSVLSCNFSL